ncbi:MAG: hypothetical protein MK188_08140 [Gammaproteobacteria bacterium]|nr:hypothetical protein [Gammaproteobacteria bacterium]
MGFTNIPNDDLNPKDVITSKHELMIRIINEGDNLLAFSIQTLLLNDHY